MTILDLPVGQLMHGPVMTVRTSDTCERAEVTLRTRNISCAPVVDANNQAVGVLSRTDLLRRARVEPGSSSLSLEAKTVGEVMHPRIVTVEPHQPITYAARRMVNGGFHRVFVHQDGKLVGVVSTREVLAALSARPVHDPISTFMTVPARCLASDRSWLEASDLLQRERVSAVIVLRKDGYPIGVVSQRDALMARGCTADVTCGEIMTSGALCLPPDAPLSSAASQAYASDFRRVIVLDPASGVQGVLTGTDFARAIA